ncbi:MAG: hypothetical protein FJZ87_09220 [Chloroflexi bacterium]|nr:hypothetical protein [Chloroflexota bacterium]
MPRKSKKKRGKQLVSKYIKPPHPIILEIVLFCYEYLKEYYVPGAVIVLFLVIMLGKPVGIDWIFVSLIVLLFGLMHYLIKTSELK